MIGIALFSTLTRLGRSTVSQVSRSPLGPCRLHRAAQAHLRRRRARAVAEVDWFDGIGPDELAG
jgi:hypothetical protein